MDLKGRFYPYKISNATLAARPQVRFFVESVGLSAQIPINTAGGKIDNVTMTVNGVASIVAQIDLPVTAAASDASQNAVCHFTVGLLGDLGTAVTLAQASTANEAFIRYAEIDQNSGQYA